MNDAYHTIMGNAPRSAIPYYPPVTMQGQCVLFDEFGVHSRYLIAHLENIARFQSVRGTADHTKARHTHTGVEGRNTMKIWTASLKIQRRNEF